MITSPVHKICFQRLAGNHQNERVHAKYRPNLLPESVITINSDKTWGRVFPYGHASATKSIFLPLLLIFVAIYGVCVASFFVHWCGVFEHWRERAADPLFLAISLERNTLPLTGCFGWWVVVGGWWLVGWWLVGWVWLLGMDHWFRYELRVSDIYEPHLIRRLWVSDV